MYAFQIDRYCFQLMVLLANEFIKDVTEGSCKVASLRNTEEGSDQTVEVSDLALYLSNY